MACGRELGGLVGGLWKSWGGRVEIFYVALNEVIDGGGLGHESVQSDKIFRNGGSLFYFLQPFGAVGVVDR